MQLIETVGKIVFDPVKDDSYAPFWALVEIEGDICDYYQWFLKKRFRVRLQKPLWGAHVSFIRGEVPQVSEWGYMKALWNNYKIALQYDPNIRTNGRHWWLRIECPLLKEIRTAMHLPEETHFNLHLTIGNANAKYLLHSEYIWRMCLKFDL